MLRTEPGAGWVGGWSLIAAAGGRQIMVIGWRDARRATSTQCCCYNGDNERPATLGDGQMDHTHRQAGSSTPDADDECRNGQKGGGTRGRQETKESFKLVPSSPTTAAFLLAENGEERPLSTSITHCSMLNAEACNLLWLTACSVIGTINVRFLTFDAGKLLSLSGNSIECRHSCIKIDEQRLAFSHVTSRQHAAQS